MYISDINVKSYLSGILKTMESADSKDLAKFHTNIVTLERVESELIFYQGVVKSKELILLLEDVKCLVDYYLLNRYIVLNNKSVIRQVKKRIKKLQKDINSFKLEDSRIDIMYIKSSISNVLQEICLGADIRKYDDIISNYSKLSNNLKSLLNIVTDMDMLDEELHFIDTFLDSKFLYLGVQRHRGNLKRIAESLLTNVV